MAEETLFDELDGIGTVVTPMTFCGADREIWDGFIAEFRKGRWANIPRVKLFEVLKRRTSMNCSLSTFRWALNRELQEPADGKTQSAKTKSRRRAAS